MRPALLVATLTAALIAPLPAQDHPDTLFARGQLAMARDAYAKIPGSPVANRRVGLIALWANQLDSAAALLEPAVLRDSTDREAITALAELRYRQRRFADAATLLRRVGRSAAADKLAGIPSPNEVRIDASTVRVPFAPGAILPVVSVRVNGREASFLIDTGAGETILDPAFADSTGARLFGLDSAVYAGGRRATFRHGVVDSIAIGNATILGIPVKIQPTRAYAPAAGGRTVDGIIGTVLLSHFLTTLDFGSQQLILQRRDVTPPAGDSVPFWLLGDHFITVAADAAGIATLLVFDTGLAMPGGTLVPSAWLVTATNVTLPQHTVSGAGGGGTVRVTPFAFPRLRVGGVEVTDGLAVAGAFPEVLASTFGTRIGGLLSHGFYAGRAVTLDFVGMRLIVAPSQRERD